MTLTILLLAGLIPHVSITVNAEVTLDDFPYKKFFAEDGYYYAIISKAPLTTTRQSGNYPPSGYWDYNTGMSTDATANQDWYSVQGSYNANTGVYTFPEAYLCTWYPTGWELRNGWGSGIYLCLFPVLDELTTLPSDFPKLEFESLEAKLSQTTATTNSALNIQSSIGTSYTNYQNGTINLATLEADLQSALSQLETLAQASGNTLSDQIAVNNAITYTQTIQQITNTENIIDTQTVSSELSNLINNKRQKILMAYFKYTNENGIADLMGYYTQEQAIEEINYLISEMYMESANYTSIADINAINSFTEYANNYITSIQQYKELDSTVSEKSQASDQEELEYLENLEAETTDNIDSLKIKVDSSINETQAQQIKNQVIQPILENTLLVKILPIAGLFMVLAVTLGFKYKL